MWTDTYPSLFETGTAELDNFHHFTVSHQSERRAITSLSGSVDKWPKREASLLLRTTLRRLRASSLRDTLTSVFLKIPEVGGRTREPLFDVRNSRGENSERRRLSVVMARLLLPGLLLAAASLPFLLNYGASRQNEEKGGGKVRSRRQVPPSLLVTPPIPTSIGHYLGTDQTLDSCMRDEVQVHPQGGCHRLLTQGPCNVTEMVLLDPETKEGFCAARLCSPDRIFVFSDQLCHDPLSSPLCPPGRQLYQTAYGTPVCQCPDGTYEGDDDLDDDVCDPILGQTLSCSPGQVFWFVSFSDRPQCLPDPCGGANLNRGPSDLPFVPSAGDGRCFQLGQTTGVCPKETWYSLALEKLQGECSGLEDAGYQVFDLETLDLINRIYGPPVRNDGSAVFTSQSSGPGSPGAGPGLSSQAGTGSGLSSQAGAGSGLSGQAGAGTDLSGQAGVRPGLSSQAGRGSGLSGQAGAGSGLSGQAGAGPDLSGQAGAGPSLSSQVGAELGLSSQAGAGSGLSGQASARPGLSGQAGARPGQSSQAGTGSGLSSQSGAGSGQSSQAGTGSGLSSQSGAGSSLFSQTGAGSGLSSQAGTGSGLSSQAGAGSGLFSQTGAGSGLSSQAGTGSSLSSQAGAGSGLSSQAGAGSGLSSQAGTGSSLSSQVGAGSSLFSQTGAGSGLSSQAVAGSGLSSQAGAGPSLPNQAGTGPVLSSQAGTGPVLSSQAGTGPVLSSQAGTGPVLSSQAGTGPVLSSQAGTGPVLSSQAGAGPGLSNQAGARPGLSGQGIAGSGLSSQAGAGPRLSSQSGAGPRLSSQSGAGPAPLPITALSRAPGLGDSSSPAISGSRSRVTDAGDSIPGSPSSTGSIPSSPSSTGSIPGSPSSTGSSRQQGNPSSSPGSSVSSVGQKPPVPQDGQALSRSQNVINGQDFSRSPSNREFLGPSGTQGVFNPSEGSALRGPSTTANGQGFPGTAAISGSHGLPGGSSATFRTQRLPGTTSVSAGQGSSGPSRASTGHPSKVLADQRFSGSPAGQGSSTRTRGGSAAISHSGGSQFGGASAGRRRRPGFVQQQQQQPHHPMAGFMYSQEQHSRELFGGGTDLIVRDPALGFSRAAGAHQTVGGRSLGGGRPDSSIVRADLVAGLTGVTGSGPPGGHDLSFLRAPEGHRLHGFMNGVRSIAGSLLREEDSRGKKRRRRRRSPLPHATPANVFETRLVGCRAGAQRDINAKCRNTILPSRLPVSRATRAAPPVPPNPSCPSGQAFTRRRVCASKNEAINTINAYNLG